MEKSFMGILRSRFLGITLRGTMLVSLLSSTWSDAPVAAQEASPSAASAVVGTLKTGEAVLDAYVAAIGGVEKYKSLKSLRINSTFSMAAAGVKAPMTISQQAPNRYRMELTIPGLPPIVQICDGENVYSKEPQGGARMLEGAEKDAMLLQADFDSTPTWRDTYLKAELKGMADVEGKPAYQVELSTKEGLKLSNFYDAQSLLLVQTQSEQNTVVGPMKITTSLSDYRDVQGIKMPHKSVQSVQGQSVEITIEKIEANLEFPAGTFEIPKQ